MSRLTDLFAEESPDPIARVGGSNAYALEDLLEEIPVSLEVFIRDKKYLGETTFKPSPIQAEAIQYIERIYFPEMYPLMGEYEPYWNDPIRLTNYHALQWGKGGGKDSICRMSFLRIAYLFMCLKNPQAYYGIPDDDNVHMLNVATSASQAQRAFFNPLKNNVKRGWFAGKSDSTVSEIKFDKGLIGISGHSETESQEGLNLLLGICDEIDGFRRKADLAKYQGASQRDSSRSAEAIVSMMRSSGITRFPEVFKQVYISYPRYLGSMIQEKTQEGRTDNEENGNKSRWYVSGPHATWEVKPAAKKWHFSEEYKHDPIEARAKYGCDPTYAQDPYFKNEMQVDSCFRNDAVPAISISYHCDGRVWTPEYEFSEDFYPIVGAQYAMHADLAVKGDRAGIALAHVVKHEMVSRDVIGKGGELIRVDDPLPYVKVDFIIGFEADIKSDPPREIQIRWARDLWAELKLRGFNIRQFSYDGYQSTESRQEFERMGVESPIISTDRTEDPWKGLRDLFQGGRVSMPYSDILREELLGLTKRTNGKVDHTAYKSKDMADALACACTGAIMLGGEEAPNAPRAYYAKPEFLIARHGAPELEIDSRDLFNMHDGGWNFEQTITGDGFGIDSDWF